MIRIIESRKIPTTARVPKNAQKENNLIFSDNTLRKGTDGVCNAVCISALDNTYTSCADAKNGVKKITTSKMVIKILEKYFRDITPL
jgi:hypothetical protein